MRRLWFVLLLLVSSSRVLFAQQPQITLDTPVSSSVLRQWLHSGEPHQIAWAAYFARTTHDRAILEELPALLEPVSGDDAPVTHRRAVLSILDALIQENIPVSPGFIRGGAESYPAQALILIGRLPMAESRQTLSGWTYGTTGNWTGQMLARVATMMLAKEPTPDLIARVVGASEEVLHITVRADDSEFGYGTGGSCGSSGLGPIPSGWPPIYGYSLVEDDPGTGASPLVELDGDRISSRRFDADRPEGACSGVQPLNAVTRHRLIAYWLGIPAREMAWQPMVNRSIRWTNRAGYLQELGALTEAERKTLRGTVEALSQRGILPKNMPATTMPRLVVTVECDIKPCPLSSF